MRRVAEIASRFGAPSATWIDRLEQSATAYLEANPGRGGSRYLEECRRFARLARTAIKQGDAQGAAFAGMASLQAAWQAEIAEARVMIDSGVKSYRKAEAANKAKSGAVAEQRNQWRKQADVERKKSRRPLSKLEIARRIDAKQSDKIRRYI